MTGAGKVFIKTYGCQMNVYDQRPHGGRAGAATAIEPTDDADDADLVVLNTCHIREKAAEKVFSELGRLRELKDERAAAGSDMLIGVAGCVAQAEGEEIVAPRAGGRPRRRAAEPITACPSCSRAPRDGERVVDTDFPAEDKFDAPAGRRRRVTAAAALTAFLTVQEGCDKFCTFCVVPYTRGAEVSRPVAQVAARRRERWSTPACASSPCSARTSTPITALDADGRAVGARRAAAAGSPRSPGSRASATPPAIRATWTTT